MSDQVNYMPVQFPKLTEIVIGIIAIVALGLAIWALAAFYADKGSSSCDDTDAKDTPDVQETSLQVASTQASSIQQQSQTASGVNARTGSFALTRVNFFFPEVLSPYQTESGFHYLVRLNLGQSTLKLPTIPVTPDINGDGSNVDKNVVYNYPVVRITIEPIIVDNPTIDYSTGSLNVVTKFTSGFATPQTIDILTAPEPNGTPVTYEYTYHWWFRRWHRIDMDGVLLDGTLD